MYKELNEDKCVCSICGKVFNSERRLNGHMKVHKPEYEEQKRRQVENSKRKAELLRKQKEEDYYKNPKLCVECGNPLSYKQAITYKSKTCSLSCSVAFGNKQRGGHSEKTKQAIANGMKRWTSSEEGKMLIDSKRKYTICPICGKVFNNPDVSTCSPECGFQLISQKRIQKIIKDGTSNTSSRYILTYNGEDYRCDSKLEIASVIFMIENMKLKRIERFTSILNFKDKNGRTRRYNPDFICDSDGETMIIEVKQDTEKITGGEDFKNYKMFLTEKKETLEKFCNERNYKWLWLTPSYDIELRRLYRRIISGKHNYTYTKIE